MSMHFYPQAEAIDRIGTLAGAGRPFLFIIDYRGQQAWVEEIGRIDAAECRYDFNGVTNVPLPHVPCPATPVEWHPHPPTLATYRKAFDRVKQHLYAGNSYLVNLTCRVPVDTNLDLEEIFRRSQARYKLWLKDRLVCFSPEIFVRIVDGTIRSYPMKGTIDATLPEAEQQLRNDPKEAAEHATIVDLIRNDLSMVADGVRVERYRYCDRLETNKGPIFQTSSEIVGTLPPDYPSRLGELLFRLLPAGSITGAPKPKTMEIIAETEDYERGFYTGVMGYSNGTYLDSAVMIRFVEQAPDGALCYKAGGGITAKSDLQSEYNEMIQKVYVPIC